MNELAFLRASPEHPAWRSPLARPLADAPPGIRDISAEAEDGALGPAAGVAGIEIAAPFARTLLARLTELQPPAIGAVARVRTQVEIAGPARYRIWFPQEYAEYMAGVVLDAWEGVA